MPSLRPSRAKTWIEISAAALSYNYQQFAKRVAPTVVFPIVKANAYGHGLAEVVSVLQTLQPTLFGVDSLQEALSLQLIAPEADVLILGHISFNDIPEAVAANVAFVACQTQALEIAAAAATADRPARIHLELETGLYRQGVLPVDLPALLDLFKQDSRLFLDGVCMHFANIEDTQDSSYSQRQLIRYQEQLQMIEATGLTPHWRHTACSAAGVLFPETWFDAIRLGISLYGIWSSSLVEKSVGAGDLQLEPVLTWKTVIAQLKIVAAGEPIGYGLTEITRQETKLAILPIGYADGFDRVANGSKGVVLIRGQRCRVMGRICMNMCMVDVTHLSEVEVEDEVIMIGRQDEEEITADELAERAGTISYEIVARLNPLIPRVVY